MDKILELKNLKVSFRTNNGTVKAVRDISFDLERGKTLAVVGESGSGKSVTSKAILGILAGNAIIEGGEIIYDGRDLLKVSEEDMCKIRGDKISMIFQDPLSSLNPIVRIGKQITEAMLLKNKAGRKESRRQFNDMLAMLKKNMTAANTDLGADKVAQLCKTFDQFCIVANRMEHKYNDAITVAEDLKSGIEDFLFRMEKHQKMDVKASLQRFRSNLKTISNPFFAKNYGTQLSQLGDRLGKVSGDYKKGDKELPQSIVTTLKEVEQVLTEMENRTRPDFFSIGYYKMRNPQENLTSRDVAELNAFCQKYIQQEFMDAFVEAEVKGVAYSGRKAMEKKKTALEQLEKAVPFFQGQYDSKDALHLAKELSDSVEASIDRLEINKDSLAYTFRTSLNSAINKYFRAMENNPKEEKRFEQQTKQREALIAKGKKVDWSVVPKQVYDLEELHEEVLRVVTDLQKHYTKLIAQADQVDYRAEGQAIIEFMKDKASKVVYKVTRAIAKERAIKLMEEVGISEPRMRYTQYPFGFSGGMRQRIVIAIALAANPEILICDEPTTALDVTIQAQILELINKLKKERNLSVIFITHDLGVVANMADDIAVMYAGKIVEYGTADDIFYDPKHPYTWALLSSMPDLDTNERLEAIPGTPPNMIYPPVGDACADRNKYAMEIDFEQQPPMFQVSDTHYAATWLLHPDAPKVDMPAIIRNRIERMNKKAGGAQNG